MAQVNQGGCADEEKLQHPVAHVGDGERLVIADVGAARLGRVALEIRLLIAPDGLSSQAQDEDAEDEEHCEPDLAHHILVDAAQQGLECLPVHGAWLGPGRPRHLSWCLCGPVRTRSASGAGPVL
uniref:Uncharacterized protein n=1 Tax=Sciurus vulgaris TaxID=55149 RepID=A0A8D2CJY6_SCIVU